MKKLILLIAVAFSVLAGELPGADAEKPPVRQDGSGCHAVLVGGAPGTVMYAARYRDWLKRFRSYLTGKAGVPAGQVTVVSADEGFSEAVQVGTNGFKAVTAAIAQAAGRTKPGDQFILFIVGHGTVLESDASLSLPVKDLSAKDLARALAGVKAKNQVILNFSTAGGGFLGALAQQGRINVTANNASEANAPVFAELFLRGLESGLPDGHGAQKDGHITILENFNWAAWQTALWMSRQIKDGSDWIVEGKESCDLFKKLYDFPDDPEGKKLSPKSKPGNADAEFDLVVKIHGKPAEVRASRAFWQNRRGLSEHALLEDVGGSAGVSPLVAAQGSSGYVPIAAADEEAQGALSSRCRIGSPVLLPFVAAVPPAGRNPNVESP